ncbi:MAG TPA: NEAT domain-containing protein [Clostridiales bacterium]|nr:NEAT domain-containing protein [Clostridiales bacterium]
MKKKLTLMLSVISALAMVLCMAVPTFAASAPKEDGTYEVPVKMMHAEKDKTSMGDKYLVHTGILKVKGNQKTLTIATNESVDGMQFWYYKNGGVEGDTVEVKSDGKTTIAGKTYADAFTFPIKSSGSYVGVKFAAPGMPMSPSARIYVDYANAKSISGSSKKSDKKEAEKDSKEDDDKNSADTSEKEESKENDSEEGAAGEEKESDAEQEAESETEASATTTKSSTGRTVAIICLCVIGLALIVALIVGLVKNKGKKNKKTPEGITASDKEEKTAEKEEDKKE